MNRPARKGAILTIANGATISGSADLGEGKIVGILTDSAFDTADISIQVSLDGGTTFVALRDQANNAIKVTAAIASTQYGFDEDERSALRSVRRVRVVSSVAQAGATNVTIIVE
jgi:hypothetical protein